LFEIDTDRGFQDRFVHELGEIGGDHWRCEVHKRRKLVNLIGLISFEYIVGTISVGLSRVHQSVIEDIFVEHSRTEGAIVGDLPITRRSRQIAEESFWSDAIG
jgi:hypothetical protein